MKSICIWLTGLLELTSFIRYAYLLRHKRISPTPAMWVMFTSGVGLSFLTYAFAEQHDFRSGILNTVDVAGCGATLILVLLWGARGERFDRFERWYLAAAGLVVVYWIASKDPITSNICTQLLIGAGYIPTLRKMRRVKKNTEPFMSWTIMLLAALAGLYPAIANGNALAVVYVVRTIIMVSFMLILMAVYHFRTQRRSNAQKTD